MSCQAASMFLIHSRYHWKLFFSTPIFLDVNPFVLQQIQFILMLKHNSGRLQIKLACRQSAIFNYTMLMQHRLAWWIGNARFQTNPTHFFSNQNRHSFNCLCLLYYTYSNVPSVNQILCKCHKTWYVCICMTHISNMPIFWWVNLSRGR